MNSYVNFNHPLPYRDSVVLSARHVQVGDTLLFIGDEYNYEVTEKHTIAYGHKVRLIGENVAYTFDSKDPVRVLRE